MHGANGSKLAAPGRTHAARAKNGNPTGPSTWLSPGEPPDTAAIQTGIGTKTLQATGKFGHEGMAAGSEGAAPSVPLHHEDHGVLDAAFFPFW
jgi:hypothetical protein